MQPPTQAVRPAAATRIGAEGFTTSEVAAATGFAPRRVREFVRRGLLAPTRSGQGAMRFTFQDMALLRTLRRLLGTAVPTRKTLATLAELQRGLAAEQDGKALAGLPLAANGDAIVLREGDAMWDARTGQGNLDFDPRRRAGKVVAIGKRAASAGPKAAQAGEAEAPADELDSDDWYNLGLDFEETAPPKAAPAYRRAISINPANADAHVNLGRLCQVQGDLKRAKRHYQMALHAQPKHQLALYNMGTVFDELDEPDTALGYYAQAPDVPDAHYNTARIFEMRGDELASRRHMRRYRGMMEGE